MSLNCFLNAQVVWLYNMKKSGLWQSSPVQTRWLDVFPQTPDKKRKEGKNYRLEINDI